MGADRIPSLPQKTFCRLKLAPNLGADSFIFIKPTLRSGNEMSLERKANFQTPNKRENIQHCTPHLESEGFLKCPPRHSTGRRLHQWLSNAHIRNKTKQMELCLSEPNDYSKEQSPDSAKSILCLSLSTSNRARVRPTVSCVCPLALATQPGLGQQYPVSVP
jgi:hypothetical protein